MIISVTTYLIVGLILLGGVQMGYFFYIKRELQNTADMAALSAVQLIKNDGTLTCDQPAHPAQLAAMANIAENFQYGALSNPVVLCGTWDPERYTEEEHFKSEAINGEYNAIQVDLTYEVPVFLPFSVDATITANAIAKKGTMPVAVFSVAPALLSLEKGTLTLLLSNLGLDAVGTNVASYQGITDVKIKTSGLLKELLDESDVNAVATVGDLNSLLNTNVGLGDIVVAAVKAADADLIDANVLGSLTSVQVQLNTLYGQIPLGPGASGRGLFAEIMAPSVQSALNAEIGIGDILNVVLDVANKKHAAISLPLDLEVGGLLKASAPVKVIEPASIGIGGKGATAYSSSVRAFVHLCVKAENDCDEDGFDSGVLKLKVDMPVGVEAITGKATLDSLCERKDETEDKNSIANITTISKVLGLCVGDIAAVDVFSPAFSCTDTSIQPKELASLEVLGADLLNLNSNAAPEVLSTTDNGKDYIEGDRSVLVNTLPVGKTLKSLVKEATVQLLMGGEGGLGDDQATGTGLWDEMVVQKGCDPEPWGISGSSCRKEVRNEIVDSLKTGLNGLIGNLVDNVLKGKLLTGLVKLLNDVLLAVLGNSLDSCAPTTVGGASIPGGTVNGCIEQIDKVLTDLRDKQIEHDNQNVSALLTLITGLLSPSLDGLGGVLSALLDKLGVEVNPVETKLISLSCDSGAQLVY